VRDKTSFLRRVAARALDGSSAPLREAFFRVYSTIDADGDKAAALMTARSDGAPSPALTLDVIRGPGGSVPTATRHWSSARSPTSAC
jgi:hypothetical protein